MSIDPADYYIRGVKDVVRPTPAAVGGFRGLQLILDDFDDWITVAPDAVVAVTWPIAQFDTDGFRSTGPFTFSFITVSTGSALVVPAGLAGHYRISSNVAYTHGPGAQTDEFGISAMTVVNDQEEAFPSGGVFEATTVGTRYGAMASSIPAIVLLEEGDVVWVLAHNLSSVSDMTIFSRSWFLAEYLG